MRIITTHTKSDVSVEKKIAGESDEKENVFCWVGQDTSNFPQVL